MDWLSGFIDTHGIWLGALAVFVGGLALNLTPCVYPMIPVTLAFFTSQAAGSWRRIVQLAAWYVAGISLSYALLGLAAAKTGALLGSWLQQPMVLVGVSVVIVALSLSMFGVYELQAPRAVSQRLSRAFSGSWGALAMGLVVGVVAAPCVGPFILGLMLLVSQLANPAVGFLLFFVMGLGMGMPMVMLAIAANRIGRLPRGGAWLVWGKRALGVALIGIALFLLRPLWPASHASAPRVGWLSYTAAAFAEGQRAGRPMVIDVYADWCLPCLELDHVTFRHPEVVRALSGMTTLLVDVTREASAEQEALLRRYRIVGVPTVLVFDAQGQEREDLRLTGFEAPQEFVRRLQRLKSSKVSTGTP